jgi:uncharacterized PurR-regulated membrane protein YhhQ (DUF165 family)
LFVVLALYTQTYFSVGSRCSIHVAQRDIVAEHYGASAALTAVAVGLGILLISYFIQINQV